MKKNMINHEEWRDIKNYEGLYQVSNFGRLKSLCNGKERILKPSHNNKGYLQHNLYKDGKLKMAKIHRLVAEAFIPNPDNYPTVDHIDRNPSNNTVENLRWADYKMQISNSNREHLSKSVIQYSENFEKIAIYSSAAEAERKTGTGHQNIARCCKGKCSLAGGFRWRYA